MHRFCQLGAIRLDARRAMMFFFDAEYAYILAESTRTLSLQDDSVYDEDDSLWLGSTYVCCPPKIQHRSI